MLKSNEKHFNKNLIMSEEEEQFQSSNNCWICENLLIMTMKKLDIIVTLLENLEVQLTGVVT